MAEWKQDFTSSALGKTVWHHYKVNISCKRHYHSVVRNRIVAIVEMVHSGKFILVRIFRFQAGRAVMASFYSGVKVA